jgi:hypothetical protein
VKHRDCGGELELRGVAGPQDQRSAYVCSHCGGTELAAPYIQGYSPLRLTDKALVWVCAACGCIVYDRRAHDGDHEYRMRWDAR